MEFEVASDIVPERRTRSAGPHQLLGFTGYTSALSLNDEYIAVGLETGFVKLYHVATRKCVVKFRMPKTYAYHMHFAADVLVMLTRPVSWAEFASHIVVLDARTFLCRKIISFGTMAYDLAVSANAKMCALVFRGLQIGIMDLVTEKFILCEKIQTEHQTAVRFCADPTGRGDELVVMSSTLVVRFMHRARTSILTLLAAPKKARVRVRLINKNGDNRVLVRVLRWLMR